MRPVLSTLILIAAIAPAGCKMVDETPKPPIADAKPPADPRPSRMVITMRSYPQDKDANGYADTLPVSIHLFEADGGWPLAVAIPGTFRFTARPPGGKPVASWDFDPAATPGSIIRGQAGPTYIYELSFLTGGRTDRHDVETLDVVAVFTPSDPQKQPIQGIISTHFGRTR